jgi:dihydrofolate reductase
MIIGGSQIYDLFLPKAECLYVTRVHTEIGGDAFFPAISEADWDLINSESHEAGKSNEFAFEFIVYKRKTISDQKGPDQ